jgi:predicted DNA-binding protein
MTLSVPLNPQTEARLRQLAEQAGKDLSAYVSELVERAAVDDATNGLQSVADFDMALDELFQADTRKLPPVPLTYSRQDIYVDHD